LVGVLIWSSLSLSGSICVLGRTGCPHCPDEFRPQEKMLYKIFLLEESAAWSDWDVIFFSVMNKVKLSPQLKSTTVSPCISGTKMGSG
jgi:hypothetical protein